MEEECSNCGKQTIFMFHRYDASGCLSCNEWLDAACGDPECPYCGNRPATPCEALCLADTEAGSAGARKEQMILKCWKNLAEIFHKKAYIDKDRAR